MIYQHTIFGTEQGLNTQPSYRGGSPANRIAVMESVWHLVMNVTYGLNTGESLAKLSQDGLWLKMFGDYCQVKMDGSLEEYSEIWPTWGLMLDGVVSQPVGLEPYIDESEFVLLPTPQASDGASWLKCNKTDLQGCLHRQRSRGHSQHAIYPFMWMGCSPTQSAEYYEMMMGFPTLWTDLNA